MGTNRIETGQVIAFIRDEARRAGNFKLLAAEWGVSGAFLSRIIHGWTVPGGKVCLHLGLVKVRRGREVWFERIEG